VHPTPWSIGGRNKRGVFQFLDKDYSRSIIYCPGLRKNNEGKKEEKGFLECNCVTLVRPPLLQGERKAEELGGNGQPFFIHRLEVDFKKN